MKAAGDDFDCCVIVPVTLNVYSQVTLGTNRYSFQIEVLHDADVVARHLRSYGSQQETRDPLQYLPLLEQRPEAFEHTTALVEQAITRAVASSCAHLRGVRLWLHQLERPETPLAPLDLTRRPPLAALHQARVDLHYYEALLKRA